MDSDTISTLRQHALLPSGEFKPGAISRIAELLDCSRNTVRMCIVGKNGVIWEFGAARIEKLRKIKWGSFPLCERKRGPKKVTCD